MNRVVTVLALAMATGCAAAKPQEYDASALTTEHRELFSGAARSWCFSSLRCCLFPSRNGDIVVRYGIPSECIEHTGKPCAGFASKDTGEIVLIPAATGMGHDHVMYGVMLHELGHICGCGHQASGVMAPRVDGTDVEGAARRCY